VTPAKSEWNEARSEGGTNENQVSEIECTETCRSNYPASGGGYRRYPWHPANVVGRDVGNALARSERNEARSVSGAIPEAK
jgi:hypothetical protein